MPFAAMMACGTFLTVHAGPLGPPGPPGDPTMIPIDQVDPRIPIYASMLPYTIQEPGSYYLAQDIRTTGGGIIVRTHDVTIDLMGFTLEGGTGPGIEGVGYYRTTIRNGTIMGWSGTGVLLGHEADLSGLIVANNQGSGIEVGTDSRVTGCLSNSNLVHGIIVGTGGIVRSCEASFNSENGIWASGGNGALVSGCVANENEKNGIRVDGSTTILDNHIQRNDFDTQDGKAGIWVNGDYNRIEGNTILYNNIGIDLDGSHNTIARNVVGTSLTVDFDVDPLASDNLMATFAMGGPGTPGPWDNIQL